MVHLIPAYRQKLKRSKLLTRSVKTLSKEDSESLNGCFLCTNWSVFLTGTSSLYEAADVVSSYINFCVENVINCKMVKSYPNIKLWVMPQLKDLLKGQLAFWKGDKKAAQHEIDKKIREGKQHFKTKLENSFIGNNATLYWMGIQPITGYKQQKRPVQTTDETKLHHKNTFYTRYDKRNFHMEQEWVMEENQSHSSHPVEVSEEDVRVCFRKISVSHWLRHNAMKSYHNKEKATHFFLDASPFFLFALFFWVTQCFEAWDSVAPMSTVIQVIIFFQRWRPPTLFAITQTK